MKVSFRYVLLAILLVLILVTVLSLGISGHVTARATAKDLTLKYLDQTSVAIDREIEGLLHRADSEGEYTRRLVETRALPIGNSAGIVDHFRRLMATAPSLTGMFLGTEPSGECVGVSRLREDHLLVWELRKNPTTNRLEIREYEPDDFPNKPLRMDPEGYRADSRLRPWYTEARAAGRQTWSRAYPFYLSSGAATVPGITCATPLYGDGHELVGVLGIDIRLDRFCDFLRTLVVGKEGFPFVVELGGDGSRHVIAHPRSDILLRAVPGTEGEAPVELVPAKELSDTRVKAFMEHVPPWRTSENSPGATPLRFMDEGTPYLGTYRVLDGPGLPSWLLCTVIPEDEVLEGAHFEGRLAIVVGLGVLMAAALISVLVSGRFARSLVLLVRETQAVGRFQLEPRKPILSRLSEVDHLARATEQMKTSLRSFGKYVPTDLVRQLLASGVEARLGGVNRELTIFFCDLVGFTSVSESLTPLQLVEQLGEYFEAFTDEVAATGGTVDKFIGDAVMAFWGAPTENPGHAVAACRCALACQRRLAALRTRWKEQGKPLLFARIGINTGPVVVGNIGSASRLNYTVIGDAVNVASRLEGLNKFYETSICLSEDTLGETAGAVVARPIDRVSVKGKSTAVLVYELLGMAADADDDMRRIAEIHGRGLEHYRRREWRAAITEFAEVVRDRPGDSPATELLRRCRALQHDPPGPDWDAVNHMTSK
jgi:adenylate cyclase